MDPELFEDLGWTLDPDPPNLMEFRDNMDNNSTHAQDSVNNTVKSVAHTNTLSNHDIQVHSTFVNTPKSPQKPKLRRSQRLKQKSVVLQKASKMP